MKSYRSHLLRLVALILVAFLVSGAKTPEVRVQRPWMRVTGHPNEMPLGSRIQVAVKGQTMPLIGGEELAQAELKSRLSELLSRRGFFVTDTDPEFTLALSYKTEKTDRLSMTTASSSFSYSAMQSVAEASAGANYGLGVVVAQAFLGANLTESHTSTKVKSEVRYTHVVSVEGFKGGNPIWKGEALWDSETPDVASEITPALQLTIARLPHAGGRVTTVPEVKKSHVDNYYRLNCWKRAFACPALPYPVFFIPPKYDRGKLPLIIRIGNPEALAACVDLMETAEYTLPTKQRLWKNPLKRKVWAKVELGGRYDVNGQPWNVMMGLRGTTSGYIVDECRLVTESEFAEFESKLWEWRKTVAEYYNVYKD